MVYDLLYGLDTDYQPHPQMIEGHSIENDGLVWDLTLREGLRFHSGEPVLARDCVATILRWGKRDAFGSALMARTDEVSAPSDRVIRIRLKRPFAMLPLALAQPACSIMPERIARTDANTQITDTTGSGPFRFVADERIQGSRTVYARFEGYVPRQEGRPSFLAGPRIVHFDRVVWTFLPDPATSAAAMIKGEFDWWENPPIDLVAMLRGHRNLVVDVKNRMGGIGCIRFNHLYPPFDNPVIRRLVLSAVNQRDFMEAYAGAEPELYRTGVGLFTPGTPMATDAGVEAMKGRTDFDTIRQELAIAGYKNEKVVMLAPSTIPSVHAESLVAGDLLRRMGFNLDYQALEWGMVVARRASKEPPGKGGWNIFVVNLTSFNNVFVPAQIAIRSGPDAWFGWPNLPRLEALRESWLDADTEEEQKRIVRELQMQAFQDVPYVPLGQFFQPAAFSKTLADIQPGWPVFHAVRRI
jgi:peptide/nickel transport system substrate-binding protein